VEAPIATPTEFPGNEVSGDPALADVKKRAPKALPLFTTADIVAQDNQPDELTLLYKIESEVETDSDNDRDITPLPDQLNTWKIDGIPIGATGMWYPFGNTPQKWKMHNLEGCTAIFIIVSDLGV
jgi:hypothetical protein